jgi:penicillin amidase
MTGCRAHRHRTGRLLRLPSVRQAGTGAATTVIVAVLTIFTGLAWLPIVVFVVGIALIAGHLWRRRARLALETRMVRALLGAGGCGGDVTVPGLSAPVRAETTTDGVTRLTARTWHDAVTALGYVMGRDRGFQLDLLRRTGAGRLAEVWGRTALPMDRTYRPLGLAAAAAVAADALAEPERALLAAFADGVNAALGDAPFENRFLAVRPEPWTATDSLVIALLMCHALSWTEQGKRAETVLRQVFPADIAEFFLPGPGDRALVPGLADWRTDGPVAELASADRAVRGSNCWVRATADGAVLACDLHLGLTMPGPLYEVDIAWGDERVRGLAAVGLPVVLTGTNNRLSWGVTNLSADVLDLVQVNPDRTHTRRERIRVRGGTAEDIEVTTQDGMPVVPGALPPSRVALRWTGHRHETCDLKFQRLAHAGSVEDGAEILRSAQGIALNVLLADDQGHTAHLATGLLPDRATGGHLAPAERPARFDPPEGFLVSANDTEPAATTPIWYDPDPGYRARRLRTLLADAEPDPDVMRAIQRDLAADVYLPYRDLAVNALAGEDEVTARLLADWDGTADADSRAFGLLVRLRQILAADVLSPLLAACHDVDPGFRYAYRSLDAPLLAIIESGDPALLPGAGDWPVFLRGCVARASTELGTSTWGELNAVGLDHPLTGLAPWAAGLLSLAPRPMSGALHTVCTCVPGFAAAGRAVLPVGAPERASFELPGGQSGHPLSRHYTDRHQSWASARARPSAAAVECARLLCPETAGDEEIA